jgi:predicted ribosome quality control (RQC) complex YloA/Tae2 family protein
MQPVDLTTLTALCAELRAAWIPARLEQVYQRDRFCVALGLRTLEQRGWLNLCWHPQAAHLALGDAPPRMPDTFTFSQQLKHLLGGLTLGAIAPLDPWERAVDFQFAKRPGDPVLWHLYVEIMGQYSNVILANAEDLVITAAHQVNTRQSSVRQIQTGQPYERPPQLTEARPSLEESFESWRDRVGLVPGPLRRNLLRTYRGLSSNLVQGMIQAAGLVAGAALGQVPDLMTDDLTDKNWKALFTQWQQWLEMLHQEQFQPGYTATGYTVTGWGLLQPVDSVQQLVTDYYAHQLNQQAFSQLRHQIRQKLNTTLKKLDAKQQDFETRLQQSEGADRHRIQADVLMAYLHEWQPGMTEITLPDFETDKPLKIRLHPEKNAVQNAQALYKRHQKLKRAREAIAPLLAAVQAERAYLEQVDVAIAQLDQYRTPADLDSLADIQEELIQQGYLESPDYRAARSTREAPAFLCYETPSGFEVLIGRNNHQNDQLTFRVATDYDLWFHTQEIPGSHVLLRLPPGTVPDDADLQFTANLAAYYSRARQSDSAPVIYTAPKHVYKPKGAKPGIAIYQQETVLWGYPQSAQLAERTIPSG